MKRLDTSRSTNAFLANLKLACDFAVRDLRSRYSRSYLGLLWLIVTPLSLLLIYSLIFGYLFKVEWRSGLAQPSAKHGFVLPFFIGLLVYLYISDLAISAASLYSSKRTFVIKSPFPLWVLWAANWLRCGITLLIQAVLAITISVMVGAISVSGTLGFIAGFIVLVMYGAGISLVFASLGPFIGDIAEGLRLSVRLLFYASPIAYPLELVPASIRNFIWANPLTAVIEILRQSLAFGQIASLNLWVGAIGFALLMLAIGFWLHRKVKGVVADVV
jgi:lipopolysaccharide transport system permease protein